VVNSASNLLSGIQSTLEVITGIITEVWFYI